MKIINHIRSKVKPFCEKAQFYAKDSKKISSYVSLREQGELIKKTEAASRNITASLAPIIIMSSVVSFAIDVRAPELQKHVLYKGLDTMEHMSIGLLPISLLYLHSLYKKGKYKNVINNRPRG